MKKIREFATECGCSVQNIYLHLKHNQEELEGHVFQGKRGKLLDDFACDFLKSIMNPKEVVADNKLQEDLAEIRTKYVLELAKTSELEKKLAKLEKEHFLLQQEHDKQGEILISAQEEEKKVAVELEEISKLHNELKLKNASLNINYEEAQKELTVLKKEYLDLQNDIEKEKVRKLSWKERLLGRKEG